MTFSTKTRKRLMSYTGPDMKTTVALTFFTLAALLSAQVETVPAVPNQRTVEGWRVLVSTKLLDQDSTAVEKALKMLSVQLEEIVKKVPSSAVARLREVPLYFSPEYPHTPPRAEYHPGAEWLSSNGRDPAMAKGVEFTNTRIFEAETRRMPNFALHELAHAYHDRVLGFEEPRIKECYEKALASGKYDNVGRKDSEGRISHKRAYAMTNHKEYFAECTEAYFSKNDFFPYTRQELRQHDPEMEHLLEQLWQVPAQP